ncbi:MAG: 2,5-diamino-6-(ribosylamino)-4(3H)-pyrimidinone 5'-phosphate reductase [Thermoplasmatales archaeon]|nr:MAG: 2,5-diamino-6-(ribosylamino)-4(3H)-pyrimidinone 5'-phosphate reductase [Thermoplasmatales archaeon]
MKRPYVIVNCAMSADGKIALPTRKQLRISSDEDIERTYKLRNECDAVLVGIDTVLSDDPKLTVKAKYVKNPKQPLRVVLDSKCRIPKDALVLNKSAKTLIITTMDHKHIAGEHVKVVGCKADVNGHVDLECALELLYRKGVKKLLVEGGGTIIWGFLEKRLVDDLYIYIGPCVVGGKTTPTVADGLGIKREDELITLKIVDVSRLGAGILTHYKMIQ